MVWTLSLASTHLNNQDGDSIGNTRRSTVRSSSLHPVKPHSDIWPSAFGPTGQKGLAVVTVIIVAGAVAPCLQGLPSSLSCGDDSCLNHPLASNANHSVSDQRSLGAPGKPRSTLTLAKRCFCYYHRLVSATPRTSGTSG